VTESLIFRPIRGPRESLVLQAFAERALVFSLADPVCRQTSARMTSAQ